MQIDRLRTAFSRCKEPTLTDRYIPLSAIQPLIELYRQSLEVKTIGRSVENRPIYSIRIGKGKKKLLMWSQMHGNESTTTKALFDLLKHFQNKNSINQKILENATLLIIPMLNPDGAEAYTRVNANDVDLNRDAQNLTQPESRVLNEVFNTFNPDFCLNLHGQRTIFSAGNNNRPATVSFLAPAQDEERSITATRKMAMEVISEMNTVLQKVIPDQVGIYDDSFNINCVGDTFQSRNSPTILFEAGHYANDYSRNQTREYIFYSLLTGINHIATSKVTGNGYKSYLDIPSNEKLYLDIIVRKFNDKSEDLGIMYHEVLRDQKIEFIPKIESMGSLEKFYAHLELDGFDKDVKFESDKPISEGDEIDFVYINNEKYSLKIENS